MSSTMKNLSISSKVALLLLIPLLSVIFYTVKNAKDNYQDWRSSSTTESLMELAIDLGNLTHRLQIERGATVGFIQSKGARFANDLPGYRAETDKSLAELKDQYSQINNATDLPPAIKSTLNTTLAALDKLGDTRAAVSQLSVPAAEVAGYYTRTIAAILGTIPAISE